MITSVKALLVASATVLFSTVLCGKVKESNLQITHILNAYHKLASRILRASANSKGPHYTLEHQLNLWDRITFPQWDAFRRNLDKRDEGAYGIWTCTDEDNFRPEASKACKTQKIVRETMQDECWKVNERYRSSSSCTSSCESKNVAEVEERKVWIAKEDVAQTSCNHEPGSRYSNWERLAVKKVLRD